MTKSFQNTKQKENGWMETQFNRIVAKTSTEYNDQWLPLVWHLLDTAEVMQYLQSEWMPSGSKNVFGLDTAALSSLLRYLALVHDLGKATPVFQQKILASLPEKRMELEDNGLKICEDDIQGRKTYHAYAGANFLRKAGCPECIAAIIGAHHGKMEDAPEDYDIIDHPYSYYGRDNEWKKVQNDLMQWALQESGYGSYDDLPTLSLSAQMVLSGLLIMADWIASDQKLFPLLSLEYDPKQYDCKRASHAIQRFKLPMPWNMDNQWENPSFFSKRFGFTANAVQEQMVSVAANMQEPGCIIVEAPMGNGKTEAALSAAEVLISRFFLGGIAFFLPSQATGDAMFTRMHEWAESVPTATNVTVSLAHAMAYLNEEFMSLGNASAADSQDVLTTHSFFGSRKTKLLADMVVGTVDQLLMAGLKQKHVMLRHLGLVGKVVIVDECHAYDSYMSAYLDQVLSWLGSYHVPVILLSATLPGKRRAEMLAAYQGKKTKRMDERLTQPEQYPLLSWTEGEKTRLQEVDLSNVGSRTVAIQQETEDGAENEIASLLASGGCVGIILNTVRRVQAFAEKLAQRFPEAKILIDHSQFLMPDRLKHEAEIRKCVDKRSKPEDRQGCIVVGSQVLEQSLDLDFDLLVTDLCPMDLLLQRIGRLHRHDRIRPEMCREAKCIVLHTAPDDFEGGAIAIYKEYLLLRTSALLPEVIRLPDDISPLVQRVYDEARASVEEDERYILAKEEFERIQSNKHDKAKNFMLGEPKKPRRNRSIVGMMRAPLDTEAQGLAEVRDGDASVEVLVMRYTEEGEAELISGERKGVRFSLLREPSREESVEIAKQRLRLPHIFSTDREIYKTISVLEDHTQSMAAEWLHSPLLEDELFLFLNENLESDLLGHLIVYDERLGLRIKEDKYETD